ncbi:NosD domain-containing protein [Cellulomonas wangsupingiae]|uniref:Right handed beta helix domain-containing protein n=1 Tax=Cellulomonas wangsupingiae TaxID=2968085 RepID=A0ABY5K9M9_9CELL|nr:NosD domain-containing protein [Cellulomonas wangsupingiae]MCC2335331.1 hypothetical protein [Cellulomonas wangsupingiae]UUI66534.1 hypothetical protein NP075_07450 [Cellulomonas wangsupingiae]
MGVIIRATVAVATVAVTVLTSGAAPTPSPGTVRCGATLTSSTTLTADLVCRNSDVGLRLAEGVVLDLGGFSLVGPGRGFGTAVTGGYTPTVRNGTIRGWNTGVMSEEADGGGAISHVLVTNTRLAIGSSLGGTATVESSTLRGNDYGITTFQSTATVTDSVLRDNGSAVVVGSDYTTVRVQRSTLRGNDIAVDCEGGSLTVESARLVENGTGVRVDPFMCGADVVDSTVSRNEVGVSSSSTFPEGLGLLLERNVFRDNTVAVDLQWSATVNDNEFRGNATALRTRTSTDPQWGPVVVRVTANDFRRNGDAVVIDGLSELGSNTAVRNTGVGISAPGATDLGGNVAWGNGVEPQCVGVVCAGRPGA